MSLTKRTWKGSFGGGKRVNAPAAASSSAVTHTRRFSAGVTANLRMAGITYPPMRAFGRQQTCLVKLRQQFLASTTAGGLVQSIYGGAQDPSGTSNWAAYKGMYDSYRVRYLKVRIDPINTVSSTAYNIPLLNSFFDEDSTGAAMSTVNTATAVAYDNIRFHEADHPIMRFFKLPLPNQSVLGKPSGWLDTSVAPPSLQGWTFNSYLTNGTVSAAFAQVTVEFYVEFHNHI